MLDFSFSRLYFGLSYARLCFGRLEKCLLAKDSIKPSYLIGVHYQDTIEEDTVWSWIRDVCIRFKLVKDF